MILVVPVVVSVLARLARRLPLVARYAVRDAARHRTRTVPAVAAVAATVAGVVALGIANASDAAESEATYTPQVAMGMGTLTVSDPDVEWATYEDAVHREAPTVRRDGRDVLRPLPGRHLHRHPGPATRREGLRHAARLVGRLLRQPARRAPRCSCWPPPPTRRISSPRAGCWTQGGVVVFTTEPVDGDRIQISGSVNPAVGRRRARASRSRWSCRRTSSRSAATARPWPSPPAGALDPMGLTARTAGLLLDAGDLSSARGGRPARGRAGDERQRLPLRRARLPERQRDVHPAGASCSRSAAC